MPYTREPIPEPATQHCPQRYRTERLAKRGAWTVAERVGGERNPPVECDRCGGWHLRAAKTNDTTTTTTGT